MIDIETVPQCEQYDDLSDRWKKLWDHKAAQLAKNGETPTETSTSKTTAEATSAAGEMYFNEKSSWGVMEGEINFK